MRCRYPTFVAWAVAADLVLFGWPLYRFALSNGRWPELLVLTALQAMLLAMALSAVSLVSLRAMKALCIALLIGNAIALYFIDTYNVILDKAMMGNVFDVDRQEAVDLLHPKLYASLLLLGVLPAWAVVRTTIVDSSRAGRLRLLVIAGVVGCGVVYAGSTTWLWFDKHARHLGGLILPWAYVANSARLLDERAAANRTPTLLPPLRFVDGPARKTIVVLAIGESARASNFSLYGYARDTNPELRSAGVIALPDARACATYTTAAIRCMLSPRGSEATTRTSEETLPGYLQRHGVQVIWRSNNRGEPPMHVALFQRADDIRKTCRDCARIDHDEILLHGRDAMLANSTSRRVFVVLHLAGSHGPTYDRKVPAAFLRFQPVCRSVDLGTCTHATLVNAYDNTILQTDHVVATAIQILAAVPQSESTLIYLSDHGESLGERGFYLHGAPNAIAPEAQRVVPFLVWMSPAFSASRHVSANDMLSKAPFGDDNIFHSVVGAFGGESAIYKPRLDLFENATSPRPHGGSNVPIAATPIRR